MHWDIFKDVCPNGAFDLYCKKRVWVLTVIATVACMLASWALSIAMFMLKVRVLSILTIITSATGFVTLGVCVAIDISMSRECKKFGVDTSTIPLHKKNYPTKEELINA